MSAYGQANAATCDTTGTRDRGDSEGESKWRNRASVRMGRGSGFGTQDRRTTQVTDDTRMILCVAFRIGAERRAASAGSCVEGLVAAAERVRSSDWCEPQTGAFGGSAVPTQLTWATLILQGCVREPELSDLEVNEEHGGLLTRRDSSSPGKPVSATLSQSPPMPGHGQTRECPALIPQLIVEQPVGRWRSAGGELR